MLRAAISGLRQPVRMSIADRRVAVSELTDEGMSNVAIGEVLGLMK